MSTRRYYEQELAYIRELGDAFSRQNPDVAGLISAKAVDPDVERLMEGFAFLTGRLRQRMDEQLPELAHGLVNMLWPQYLRPVPALTIVEFDPPAAAGGQAVPEGTQLVSRAVDGISCRFRTCHEMPLVAAKISAVELEERATSATFVLQLTPTSGGTAGTIALAPVRLFLHGLREPPPGPQLLFTLLRDATEIEVSDGRTTLPVPVSALRHAGVDDSVLPWPGNAFSGLRVMQEYLAFPESFLFLELPAVSGAMGMDGATLTWRIRLRRRPELPSRVSTECIRLNCVPAINLSESDASPITPDLTLIEHRVVPQGAHAAARVHTVERVQGLIQGRSGRLDYHSFSSYEHALPGAEGAFFTTRIRPATLGRGAETWISFVDAKELPAALSVDTIIMRLTCTDGELAQRVGLGALDQPGTGNSVGLGFRNVTRITPEAPPPLEGDLLWRLVSGLARSLQPLDDIGALRSLLAAYDMRALQDEQARRRLELRLAALQAIEVAPMETLVKGIPVRGREVRLQVAESGFGDLAGAFLFGAAFDAFLGAYAGLNTCWRLVMRGSETKAELRWPIKAGRSPSP
jgi:type VI secretion system protein ImpG